MLITIVKMRANDVIVCRKMLNVKTLLTHCSTVRSLCDLTDSGDRSSLTEAGK